MNQIKSHDYPEVYKGLGINLSTLGCVMLDTEPIEIPTYIIQRYDDGSQVNYNTWIEEMLYKAKDSSRFWIDGWVGASPHLTLLYGLLETAKNYKWHIDQVLNGWNMPSISIKEVGYFESPYADEEYYCIVGHIETTDALIEGHQRLELLPHVNTFGGYKPHVTIAYIKKDERFRDDLIGQLNMELVGKEISVLKDGINLGGNK